MVSEQFISTTEKNMTTIRAFRVLPVNGLIRSVHSSERKIVPPPQERRPVLATWNLNVI